MLIRLSFKKSLIVEEFQGNYLKGTQTNETTTVKILTSNEALIIPQIVILKPPVPYDLLVSTHVSDVSVTISCSGREVFLSFQSRMSKLACHLFTFVYRCLQGFPGLKIISLLAGIYRDGLLTCTNTVP